MMEKLLQMAVRLIYLAAAAALVDRVRLRLGEGVRLICALAAVSTLVDMLEELLPG